MTSITQDLVRRRAEHNEGEIFSLEEISLHQLDIEKIEHLHQWCPNLKILYLQGNLISKIENTRHFKRLEYLNLALNNIEVIENLQSCESLQKLDLTINFIWKLSSILCLKNNYNLKEMYLIGNPCTQFKGYRSYVIGTLQQLAILDGEPVLRSERIQAIQLLEENRAAIFQQENAYEEWKCNRKPSEGEYTIETRRRLHQEIREARANKDVKPDDHIKDRRAVNFGVSKDGRILNANPSKIPFTLQEEQEEIILSIKVSKYMDTSLIDVDVQPTYVKVLVKGHLLQLVLPAEVRPDQAQAKRSLATGSLVVTMPRVQHILIPKQICNVDEPIPDLEEI